MLEEAFKENSSQQSVKTCDWYPWQLILWREATPKKTSRYGIFVWKLQDNRFLPALQWALSKRAAIIWSLFEWLRQSSAKYHPQILILFQSVLVWDWTLAVDLWSDKFHIWGLWLMQPVPTSSSPSAIQLLFCIGTHMQKVIHLDPYLDKRKALDLHCCWKGCLKPVVSNPYSITSICCENVHTHMHWDKRHLRSLGHPKGSGHGECNLPFSAQTETYQQRNLCVQGSRLTEWRAAMNYKIKLWHISCKCIPSLGHQEVAAESHVNLKLCWP